NPCVGIPAPCKGKSIKIYGMENYKYLITNAFALAGRMGHHVVPGVPLRSSPGSALAAFSRRPHPTNRNVDQCGGCVLFAFQGASIILYRVEKYDRGASILCPDDNVV
ncbi:hypothetical protein, partial [Xylanibacter rodentium]|uniref:hypothetical protein n=1 Tax=Xylanibacter rodentium TaxID=2736289 RepID=UPI0025841265